MAHDLISFPATKLSSPPSSGHASGPSMYMRYEPGGAVRRLELPEYQGPALPETSLAHAHRIAREVEQQVALNPRLRHFDPTTAPRSLEPRRYGAGLFAVPDFPHGLKRQRKLLLKPLRELRQPSLLRHIAQVAARALRTSFNW